MDFSLPGVKKREWGGGAYGPLSKNQGGVSPRPKV